MSEAKSAKRSTDSTAHRVDSAVPFSAKLSSEQPSLAAALGCLVNSTEHADVKFVVDKGMNQRCLYAHRLILASASPVLEAMLYPDPDFGAPEEEKKEGGDGVMAIALPDVAQSGFTALLQSVYADEADITEDNLSDVIKTAQKFQLEGLKLLCLNYLAKGMTVNNCLRLYDISEKQLNNTEVVAKFIASKFRQIVTTPEFLGISVKRLEQIVQQDELDIREIVLFKALRTWARHQLKRKRINFSKKALRFELMTLLPHIRFGLMSTEEFAKDVSHSGVLDDDLMVQVFTYICASPLKKPTLPFNCRARKGGFLRMDKDCSRGVTIAYDKRKGATNVICVGTAAGFCVGDETLDAGEFGFQFDRSSETGNFFVGVFLKGSGFEGKEDSIPASYASSRIFGFRSDGFIYQNAKSNNKEFTLGTQCALKVDMNAMRIVVQPKGGPAVSCPLPPNTTGARLVVYIPGSQSVTCYPSDPRDVTE